MAKIIVEVTEKELHVEQAYKAVLDERHGAVDLFVGVVRNEHNGKSVEGMTYDAHKALAENVLHEICEDAQQKWPESQYFVQHRYGVLGLSEASVLIAVSSAHREDSFDGCRFVIEEIKTRLPVWKHEHYTNGISEWLPGHSLVAEEVKSA